MAVQAPEVEIGFRAPRFELPSLDGKTVRLVDVAGVKGTVVAFICNHCPYVQAVADRLAHDAADLAPLGVNIVAINSNDATDYPDDAFELMAPFAARHGFGFPYLHDGKQEVARAYSAVCTPDFFGFDADLALKYRGRLDASRKEAAPAGARRDLFEAMRRIAETGQGPDEQHPSIGCSIKWREKE